MDKTIHMDTEIKVLYMRILKHNYKITEVGSNCLNDYIIGYVSFDVSGMKRTYYSILFNK